jgi:lipoprotein signal peptidase
MFDFRFFPVFNIADAVINVGMLILIVGYMLGRRPNIERRPSGASVQKEGR